MKIFGKLMLSLLLLAALAAVGAGTGFFQLNSPPAEMPESAVVIIEEGETAYGAGALLERKGLIKNARFFVLYSRYIGKSPVKTGSYRIISGMKTSDIFDLLASGVQELFKVTIPEGWTSRTIAGLMEDKGICSSEAFITAVKEKKAEGCLFPDTYYFQKDYPADKVVDYLVECFYSELSEIYPAFKSLSETDLYNKVVMASIVEREYRRADEAPLIASVFYNRIAEGMPLQSCATVVYVITEELGKKHPERLYYPDLEINSPFNTYQVRGLPPAPICNPGSVAINAAFNPAESNYLYFLLEDREEGRHVFSRTFGEHNRSYQLYIKGK